MMFKVICVGLLVASGAWAGAPLGPRVAVLELHSSAGPSPQELRFFTDVVRGVAARTLSGQALVLTRENLLAQLPPGTDLAACEGECEVETGRNVGADWVVSGEVVRVGGELRAVLKAHETRGGSLVATERAAAPAAAALEGPLEAASARVFARIHADLAAAVPAAAAGLRMTWDAAADGDHPAGMGGLRVYEALSGKVLAAPQEGTWAFDLPWPLPSAFELAFYMGGNTQNERARCLHVVLDGPTPVPIDICPHPTDDWVLAFPDVGIEGHRQAAHDQTIPVRIRREGGSIKLLLDDTLVATRAAPAAVATTARVRVRSGGLLANGAVIGQFFEEIRLVALPDR